MTRSIIQILAEMPAPPTTPVGGIWCSECEHERDEKDPYGTGDFGYVVRDCAVAVCPYGKTEIDQE